MTVHPFIEAEKQAGHNVKRACELLKVSRVAFYARRTAVRGPRAVRDADLAEKIAEVQESRRRVARLMRQAGLEGRHRRRRHRTTIPDPQAATRPDLVLRDFQPDPAALDARWYGDITYASALSQHCPVRPYNIRRLHSSLGYRSPAEYKTVLAAERGDTGEGLCRER